MRTPLLLLFAAAFAGCVATPSAPPAEPLGYLPRPETTATPLWLPPCCKAEVPDAATGSAATGTP